MRHVASWPWLWRHTYVGVVCVALLLVLGGCGGAPGGGGNGNGDDNDNNNGEGLPTDFTPDDDLTAPSDLPPESTTADITLAANARIVDEDTVADALASVSEDGAVFTFADTAADIAALQPGDVAVLPGQGVRRVTTTEHEGNQVVLTTEQAGLHEVIHDGTLAWARNIDFTTAPAFVLDEDADSSWTIEPDAGAEGLTRQTIQPVKISGTVQGWEVSVSFKPASNDKLDVELKAVRAAGGVNVASVSGKGWISSFQHEASAQYSGGELTNMHIGTNGMRGEMEVKWNMFVATGGNALTDIARLRIPAAIPIPVNVGGIPLLVKLKITARIVPELRFDQSVSSGSFKVEFSSDQGFRVQNQQVSVLGSLNGANIGITGETLSAGNVAVGVGVGIEFPRVEVSIFAAPVMAFITVDTYAYGLWRPGFTEGGETCQSGGVSFKSIAGYQLSLMGLVNFSDQVELWKQDYERSLDGATCS